MEEAYSRLFNSFGIHQGHILGTWDVSLFLFLSELYREISSLVFFLGGHERIYVRIYVSPKFV